MIDHALRITNSYRSLRQAESCVHNEYVRSLIQKSSEFGQHISANHSFYAVWENKGPIKFRNLFIVELGKFRV